MTTYQTLGLADSRLLQFTVERLPEAVMKGELSVETKTICVAGCKHVYFCEVGCWESLLQSGLSAH